MESEIYLNGLHPVVRRLQPSGPQLEAVCARGVDILVTAGAGSGKTRTLTARLISLLAEGLPLRSLVAVTFTDKAAREMRNRVRRAVRDAVSEGGLPGEEEQHWREIYRELDAARIGTIHGLCAEILRTHPAEARIDPRFTVLDQAQAVIVRADAVENALSWAVSQPEAALLREHFFVADLRELIGLLIDQRLTIGAAWAHSPADAAQAALDDKVGEIARALREPSLNAAIAELREAAELARKHTPAMQDSLSPMITEVLLQWQAAEAGLAADDVVATVDALRAAHNAIKLNTGKAGAWPGLQPKAAVASVREALDGALPWLDKASAAVDLAWIDLLPALASLFRVADDAYRSLKNERNALDFDDLEQGALAVLENHDAVRDGWRAQVNALLVDEFQDTNARQRRLVHLLGGEGGKLFLVGDGKQSIYRFRGADVSVFREERERIGDSGGLLPTLDVSYRTHATLLASLNDLLRTVLGEESVAPWHEPFSPLVADRRDPVEGVRSPYVELLLAHGTKTDGALHVAAGLLAQRLQRAHVDGMGWGDMALLFRAGTSFAVYEDALEAAGIPYVTVAGRGFYFRPEIRDLLNALRAINDPTDNLALVGLLRSPMFGLEDREILRLYDESAKGVRGEPHAGAMWKALQRRGDDPSRRVVAEIDRLHGKAGRTAVADLIKELLDCSGYPVALQQAGESRAARNMAKLVDDAQRSGLVSVAAFLYHVDLLRTTGAREGEARADVEGMVQLMTIHAAKGLEFPLVALADASYSGGSRASALTDNELGLLLPIVDEEKRKGILYTAAQLRNAEMDEAESARLLYVATTRARDLLLVSGTCKAIPKASFGGWLKQFDAAFGLTSAFAAIEPGAVVATGGEAGGVVEVAIDVERIGCWVALGAPEFAGAAHEAQAELQQANGEFCTALVEPLPATPLPARHHTARTGRDDDALRVYPVLRGLQRSGVARRDIGRLLHLAYAHGRLPGGAEYEEWLTRRAQEIGIVGVERLRQTVNEVTMLLERLVNHPVHDEIQAAARRLHEVPYSVRYAEENGASDAGRMDLLYQRNDGKWVLMDFKVDRVRTPVRPSAYEQHAQQLQRYARALHEALGVEPVLRICFLDYDGRVQVETVDAVVVP